VSVFEAPAGGTRVGWARWRLEWVGGMLEQGRPVHDHVQFINLSLEAKEVDEFYITTL